MPRIPYDRLKSNLKYAATFYYEEISRISVWWLWNIPFQLFSILIGLLIYNYYALAFGGHGPLYTGGFMAYIISGLMVNTYLDTSLDVYYGSIGALYFGKMGIGGLHISRRDYLELAGISPYAFIFARVTYQYLMNTIMFILYFLTGVFFFNFSLSTQVNVGLLSSIILLGIIACSGLGLISASMYWLVSAYRGVEPINWLVRVMVPLVAGVYIPREILPKELMLIGKLLPQTYTIDAVRKVMFEGATFSQVANNIVTLIIQTAILVLVGLIALKYSLSLERKRGTIY